MTHEPWEYTAARLAAHPRFRPQETMRYVWRNNNHISGLSAKRLDGLLRPRLSGSFPDLTDWPTVGALLGMLDADDLAPHLNKRLLDGDPGYEWSCSVVRASGVSLWLHPVPGAAVALALLSVYDREVTP